jgi:hypothetical protein
VHLEQYRRSNRLTYRRLGELLGLHGNDVARRVHRYCACIHFPDPVTLLRIREVTGGAVTADAMAAQWGERNNG